MKKLHIISSIQRLQSMRALGSGLLESTYRLYMMYELGLHRLDIHAEYTISICYKEAVLDYEYQVDLMVD